MATLLVQMGHAGRTAGATGAPGEQELTVRLGQAAYARLHGRNGWSVVLLKADPPTSAYRGDAFVAFHADGNNNPTVAGASVGHQTAQGRDFAAAWKQHYGWPGTWHPDNYTTNLSGYYGVREAVRQGCRRSFIAEVGTITNPADRAFITAEEGIAAAVDAVGAALGIITQEDDMQAMEPVISPITGKSIGAFKDVTFYTNLYANDIPAIKAMVTELIAGAHDDLDAEAVLARVDAAVREATAAAIDGTVLPALRAVIENVLGEDNAEQADAIVTELAERLRPAA